MIHVKTLVNCAIKITITITITNPHWLVTNNSFKLIPTLLNYYSYIDVIILRLKILAHHISTNLVYES